MGEKGSEWTENPRVPSSTLGLGTKKIEGLQLGCNPFFFRLC